MDNDIYEISSTQQFRLYKFKYTTVIEEYERMMTLVNSVGGHFESETFPVGHKKEILLKIVWNRTAQMRFEGNSRTRTCAVLCPTVSIVCVNRQQPNISLRVGTFSVENPSGVVTNVVPFPKEKQFPLGEPGISCCIDGTPLITNPNLFLNNGCLTVIIEGTLEMYNTVNRSVSKPVENITDAPFDGQPNLEHLLNQQKFSDVDILCDGKSFSVHKGILWARSTTFQKLFQDQEKAATPNSNIISIEDVSADVFQEGLHFIYTGKCPQLKTMVADLFSFALKFGVADLKEICENEIIQNISVENACHYFSVADKLNSADLRSSCVQFLKENIKSVMASPGWNALKKEHADIVSEILEAVVKDNL